MSVPGKIELWADCVAAALTSPLATSSNYAIWYRPLLSSQYPVQNQDLLVDYAVCVGKWECVSCPSFVQVPHLILQAKSIRKVCKTIWHSRYTWHVQLRHEEVVLLLLAHYLQMAFEQNAAYKFLLELIYKP